MAVEYGRDLLYQKKNPIDEKFASFVRIKEVFLDENGLENEIVTIKMYPMIQCWDEEERIASPRWCSINQK